MRKALIATTILTLTGCGSSGSDGAPPAAGPDAQDQVDNDGSAAAPGGDTSGAADPETHAKETGELSVERALQIVAEIEGKLPFDPNHPLLTPKTTDDVEAILKLDQVNAFPKGIDLVKAMEGKDALALHGQIELAWAESYMIGIEILSTVLQPMLTRKNALEVTGAVTEQEQKEFASLQETINDVQLRVAAFKVVAIEHLTVGQERSEALIAAQPDSYLGYRVAADYYRMLRNWEQFDAMVKKIEETNPDSNGLRFQRGASAWQRDKDFETANKWLREALDKDDAFTRARVHLMLIQQSPEGLYTELEALLAANPAHQIADWSGDGVRKVYEIWKAAKEIGEAESEADSAGGGEGAEEGGEQGPTS